jgi:hypothetical protein
VPIHDYPQAANSPTGHGREPGQRDDDHDSVQPGGAPGRGSCGSARPCSGSRSHAGSRARTGIRAAATAAAGTPAASSQEAGSQEGCCGPEPCTCAYAGGGRRGAATPTAPTAPAAVHELRRGHGDHADPG